MILAWVEGFLLGVVVAFAGMALVAHFSEFEDMKRELAKKNLEEVVANSKVVDGQLVKK